MSHSGTESAVVLQCLMLLGIFQRLLLEISVVSLTLFVKISVISLLLLVLITDGRLYPFTLPALIEVFHLLKVLIPAFSLLDRPSL